MLTKAGRSLAEFVQRHDRDRYQTVLFAPAARREALFALYAFNYEVARIRESVREPMLGQIRLQWWREVIDTAYGGGPVRRHEVAEPISKVISEYGPTRAHFDRLMESRERDLDDTPFADMAALEDYAEGTSATLILLALEFLGASQAGAAAREVGIGYALVGLLRAMPFHARAGRSYIPADLAARVGVDPRDYVLRPTPELAAAVGEIAARAERHLDETGRASRIAIPALLPAVVARRYLQRLRKVGNNPYAPKLAAPDPLQVWSLLAARVTRSF